MSWVPAFAIGLWNGWLFMVWLVLQNIAIWLMNKEAYRRGGHPADMKDDIKHQIARYVSAPLWLAATLYSVFLPLRLGEVWFYASLPIFLLGLTLTILTSISFTNAPLTKPVTGGIYRYSRHPMYLAVLFIYLSVGIAAASWVFLLVAAIWLALMMIATGAEERYCAEKYGNAYRKYMALTPKWLGLPKT